MTTETQSPLAAKLVNERASLVIGCLVVCIMLVCVAVPIVEFGERLVAGWDGRYLLPAVFIVSLEAVVSWRLAARLPFPGLEWLFFRGAEAVIIYGGLKLYLYSVRGWDRLWLDLASWQQNFASFVTPEYLFAAILITLTWIAATQFAGTLGHLEGDEALATAHSGDRIESDRAAARRRLITEIFTLGGIMLFLTAILRNNLEFLGLPAPPLQTGLLNVVLYFLLGLVLLAQSQFAVLRARWMLDRIPLNTNLAPRWAAYSALLLLVCALLVIFLPTRYSIGLLELLGLAYRLLEIALAIVIFLVFVPLQYIFSLFGMAAEPAAQPPLPDMEGLAPGQALSLQTPWLEVFKSFIFWAIFLAVIGFSLVYYLRQRAGWLTFLARLRLPALKLKLKLPSLPTFWRRPLTRPPFNFISLRRLSPRDQVRYYYRALLKKSGVPRAPAQTPNEYRHSLPHLPPAEVDRLTEAFLEAQYTRHEISRPLADLARRSWENLRKALRAIRPK